MSDQQHDPNEAAVLAGFETSIGHLNRIRDEAAVGIGPPAELDEAVGSLLVAAFKATAAVYARTPAYIAESLFKRLRHAGQCRARSPNCNARRRAAAPDVERDFHERLREEPRPEGEPRRGEDSVSDERLKDARTKLGEAWNLIGAVRREIGELRWTDPILRAPHDGMDNVDVVLESGFDEVGAGATGREAR